MEFIFGVSVCFLGISAFVGVLAVGCGISDVLFQRVPFLRNWLDSFEDFEDDEEVYQEYLESREKLRRRNHGRRIYRRAVR